MCKIVVLNVILDMKFSKTEKHCKLEKENTHLIYQVKQNTLFSNKPSSTFITFKYTM